MNAVHLEYDVIERTLYVEALVDGRRQVSLFTGISGWPSSDGGYWNFDKGEAWLWNGVYESIQQFLDREVPSEEERRELMHG